MKKHICKISKCFGCGGGGGGGEIVYFSADLLVLLPFPNFRLGCKTIYCKKKIEELIWSGRQCQGGSAKT